MFTLDLDWKEFNINIPDVISWVSANINTGSVGVSCNNKFQIHFENEPNQDEKDAINDYWENLTSNSLEAVNYKTEEQILIERKLAVKAKLIALGLTEDEVKAIVG